MLLVLCEMVAEASAMNVIELSCLSVRTANPMWSKSPLERTILPGVTRASVLVLLFRYLPTAALPRFLAYIRICPAERALSCRSCFPRRLWARFGRSSASAQRPSSSPPRESGGRARAQANACTEAEVVKIVLPPAGGAGSVAQTLLERLVESCIFRRDAPRGRVGCCVPLMRDAGACKWDALVPTVP